MGIGDVGTYLPKGMFRSPRLLALARDQVCQNCKAQDGTVVAAHSNGQAHGRGKDNKAHDCFFAWLCIRCHDFYDRASTGMDPTGVYKPTREDKQEMFVRAMHRTWFELWRLQLVKVA